MELVPPNYSSAAVVVAAAASAAAVIDHQPTNQRTNSYIPAAAVRLLLQIYIHTTMSTLFAFFRLFFCLFCAFLAYFVCTQVAVRSTLLRGFDQQVAEKLGDVMKDLGVKFVRPAVPSKIEKVS